MNLVQIMKAWIAINDSYQLSMRSMIITLISGLFSYHLLIIRGFTNPDGVCEGITYYTGGDWALAGCGRWAIRYMNEMACNIVMPLYVVIMYGICIWLSIVLLSKIWEFSDSAVIALSIIMISTPVIAEQLTYTYTALAYAFSCLLSVFFVYLVFRCNWKAGIIGGTLSVAVMLGLYQSYVGMVAVLVFMTIIFDFINGKEIKQEVIRFILCGATSIAGCFLYSKILEFDLSIRELDNSGSRVAEFNIAEIFDFLPKRIPYVYKKYRSFLIDELMHRNVLYAVIIVLVVIALLRGIYLLVRKRKFVQAVFVVVLVGLIPFASNIIGILIPYNGVERLMQYQNIMLFPFMFACIRQLKQVKCYGTIQGVATLVVIIVAWTYILAANASYKCYELSYRHINSQMQIALERVYDLDDYVMNETPILIAGFPSDETLRNNMDIYQYAENLYENPVFWIGMHGATQNRYMYFLNYFGIDAQRFSDDEYAAIINASEFADMPVWPDKESVNMIDGYAVVKFTEEPPTP